MVERRGVAFHVSRFHVRMTPPATRWGTPASLLRSALGTLICFASAPASCSDDRHTTRVADDVNGEDRGKAAGRGHCWGRPALRRSSKAG